MGLLDGIEKLITEHGSAAILRERIAFAEEKHNYVVTKAADLQAQVERLGAELVALEAKRAALQATNSDLLAQLETSKHAQDQLRKRIDQLVTAQRDGNPKGYYCNHCGSHALKRTGSRPDRTFGPVGGIQAKYECEQCGKHSEFLETP